jgi:hypothetical protein
MRDGMGQHKTMRLNGKPVCNRLEFNNRHFQNLSGLLCKWHVILLLTQGLYSHGEYDTDAVLYVTENSRLKSKHKIQTKNFKAEKYSHLPLL